MSVAAPPRPTAAIPYAETQPQRAPRHAAPDWLPVIGWFVDDGQRHSRINVVPMGNTVDPYERFAVTLKFFRGAEQPVHTFLSEPFAGDEIFRYESAALLGALGESRFEGLVEITARSLDNPPSHFPWVDSWLEFWADDGSLSGSVPGFVFKGGTTKQVMSGKWQHWPGVAANTGTATSVLLLNYHPRPTAVRFDLFAPSGRCLSSDTPSIAARMPRTFDLESIVPGARELLAREGGFGSLRIWSAYKLPGFVLMRNRATGVISSFDHTVPFAGPPID
ncbi:MAG: hypothetical protein E6I52_20865 [Chloroflexi bacterium]|nr:MAG: hypothetical protein E6I52_20865 [Chloroflexota bacterium]